MRIPPPVRHDSRRHCNSRPRTKERLPGFGHKVYKDKDPRAEELLEAATKLGVAGTHTQKVRAMAEALQAHKPLALNIDGAMAAILSDMGFLGG